MQEEPGVPYKQTKRYKKAHARYMKYFRSVHESLELKYAYLICFAITPSVNIIFGRGPNCPEEIRKMACRAKGSDFFAHRSPCIYIYIYIDIQMYYKHIYIYG